MDEFIEPKARIETEFFLATVAEVDDEDGISIIPEGQASATGKKYKMLINGGFTPEAGDRVVVLKQSGTFVILGKIGYPEDNTGGGGVTYPIAVNKGGTGATTAANALTNLGAAAAADLAGKVSKAGDTMTGALNLDVPLAIASGGTGASTASAALEALKGLSKLATYYAAEAGDVIDTMTDGTALVRTASSINASLYNALKDNYAYIVQVFYGAIGSARNRVQIAYPYDKTINKMAWREYNSGWGDWHVVRNSTVETISGITVSQSGTGVATMPTITASRSGNAVRVTVSGLKLGNTPSTAWVTIATGLPLSEANYYTHLNSNDGALTIPVRLRVTTAGALQYQYGEGGKTYSSSFVYICDD